MKIAVTSTGPSLEHYVGTRAAQCGYLLIIDPDTMQYEAIQNPVVARSAPAALMLSAQLLLQKGVHTVLVGSCRAEMLKVLGGMGILILVGMTGSVRRTVEQFKHSYYSVLS